MTFAVETSRQPGPQGGKPRGYCLAWRGQGVPHGGRALRSGWYLHRADAGRACDVANDALRRDLARPTRQPDCKGDGRFLVRLTSPSGVIFWHAYGPMTPDGLDPLVSRFVDRQGAARAISAFYGNGPAFWNSERASDERQRAEHRGWQAEIVADSDLERGE